MLDLTFKTRVVCTHCGDGEVRAWTLAHILVAQLFD